MGRLQGKVVFITGASSGIGEACAREFAKEGAHLVLTARRLDRLEALKQELTQAHSDVQVLAAQLDVRDKIQIKNVVDSLPAPFKDVHVLVNNAGGAIGLDDLVDVSEEDIDFMLNTNVKGLVFVTQALVPGMIERQAGHVINVGSIAGKEAYSQGSIYCAAKHAVGAITKSLMIELVDTPVNVSCICPGLVDTEFSTVRFRGDKDKADNVYKGMQPLVAQDIAEIIVFTANRPPHVQIADLLVFPSAQAASKIVSRK
ncbi:NAD(P)-binding protein [Hesseltinella vesiculosa]|uniref:NAD(P)-binding protein n=1 Tax=Hesseltinella vesiculosa TaxID=101127 RepID=A0A1X2GWV6_9FUNG|nr:NAD(P)-binding protein [Hesseltinella vesiculosa]